MDILRFLGAYWHDILVLIAIGFAVFAGAKQFIKKWRTMSDPEKIAYVKRLLENLLPIALGLVTDAEAEYGGGTGKLKRAYVLDELYSRIPDQFKPYVTEENLDAILTKALDEARLLWEKNDKIRAIVGGVSQ